MIHVINRNDLRHDALGKDIESIELEDTTLPMKVAINSYLILFQDEVGRVKVIKNRFSNSGVVITIDQAKEEIDKVMKSYLK